MWYFTTLALSTTACTPSIESRQSGLTSFLEDSTFCEVVLDLVPGLKDKLNKLEEDMFALADKMGEHDVDKGWLREQIFKETKG